MSNLTQGTSVLSVFQFQNFPIRVFADDKGEPWFLANDVCKILDYKNSRDAISKHCRPWGVVKRDTLSESGMQSMLWINESNLYRLATKSRKPEAEVFERLVFETILPTIRQTGSYSQSSFDVRCQQQLKTDPL